MAVRLTVEALDLAGGQGAAELTVMEQDRKQEELARQDKAIMEAQVGVAFR